MWWIVAIGCEKGDRDANAEDKACDESDATTFYEDRDGDGFGDEEVIACTQGDLATVGEDCDDDNPSVHPDAVDRPDRDRNCDGVPGEATGDDDDDDDDDGGWDTTGHWAGDCDEWMIEEVEVTLDLEEEDDGVIQGTGVITGYGQGYLTGTRDGTTILLEIAAFPPLSVVGTMLMEDQMSVNVLWDTQCTLERQE